jgi:xylulokinase
VERFIDRPFTSLNFVGGGAQSDVWCQIMADVLDRPIRQMEHALQANTRGAALLAAVTLKRLTVDDIGRTVEVRQVFHPDPSARAVYDRLFDEFRALHKHNRRIYSRLNRHG